MMDRDNLTARDIFKKSTVEEKIAAATNEYLKMLLRAKDNTSVDKQKKRVQIFKDKLHSLHEQPDDIHLKVIPLLPPLESFIWSCREILKMLDNDDLQLQNDLDLLLRELVAKKYWRLPRENVHI